jgi:hypothetical protein
MLPQGDATHVTWLMYGAANFVSKLIQVFMNLDKMIGKDFEVGLARRSPRNNSSPRNLITQGASNADQSLSVLQRQLRGSAEVL